VGDTSGRSTTTETHSGWYAATRGDADAPRIGFAIAWSAHEPGRVGEVALLSEDAPERLIGRGEARAEDALPRLFFRQDRPAGFRVAEARSLHGARLSRQQLRLRASAGGLDVERIGRCPMSINGARVDAGRIGPGDTLLLEGELLLLCVERPPKLTVHDFPRTPAFAFGAPDVYGIVGESPSAWLLRDRLAFVAQREGHVLVAGPTGSGKELAARAIHLMSRRAGRLLVARNAATLPPGLIDAELFGNARNYPNPGMPERAGLIGAAHASTLLLDEIGELPHELQTHLLRVLDQGEYQRLGESTMRAADVRVVAATNRPESELKLDLLSRLKLRVALDGLDARREDIPLIMRFLLQQAATSDKTMGSRFFEAWDGSNGEPRFDPRLIELLLRHHYTHHIRELETLLWGAIADSRKEYVALTPDVERQVVLTPKTASEKPSPELIQAVLDRHGGNQEQAYRELGLRNRDVLYRLIKKHGLAIKKP
jgi:transcriptional regulator with AAA-type ATPase domain